MHGDEVLLSDGPFVESKEYVAGIDIIEVRRPRRGHLARLPAPGGARRRIGGGAAGLGVNDGTSRRRSPTAFREEWGQVVATLIRVTGDWDLAEECAQDAFAQALDRWRRDGVPRRPGAWLTTTARNRALDVLRREAVGGRETAGGGRADTGRGSLAAPDAGRRQRRARTTGCG